MKVYTIISTYPQKGSQNIGDALITYSTIDAIEEVKCAEEEIEFNIVWRAEKWEDVKDSILGSSVIIFACLAIRDNMTIIEYPYLNKILDSDIPIAVLAAGTSLQLVANTNFYDSISLETKTALSTINRKALFFSTRGLLTQEFCDKGNLNNVVFSGDIAFHDERFSQRKFNAVEKVRKIAISDPHYSKLFLRSFERLFIEVKKIFPGAEINILLHGINSVIEQFCLQNQINFERIYLEKGTGLDRYDDYDIHIGYRVHAHVSMLKRRKPSYLLEQDGRGVDYGLTLERKISVTCIPSEHFVTNAKNILRWLLRKKTKRYQKVDSNNVDLLISIIKHDKMQNFRKFFGLEEQILDTARRNLSLIEKLP